MSFCASFYFEVGFTNLKTGPRVTTRSSRMNQSGYRQAFIHLKGNIASLCVFAISIGKHVKGGEVVFFGHLLGLVLDDLGQNSSCSCLEMAAVLSNHS